MKKIVLNISDSTYEKLRFEAIRDKTDVKGIIQKRLFFQPFDTEIETAFDSLMDNEMQKILGE